MQKLISLQSKSNNKIAVISAAITAFFMDNSTYAAAAATLKHAEDALTKLQKDIQAIIPIAAAIILLCLAIGYAGRYIGKDTFVRWAIGVVIAGSAAQLVSLLFTTP
ncbi:MULTISPECIES: VirB2 family type IV secretion system major pilin TrwL [Bartonella]|uniref:VirB2 family type IV secretion system major pilin TrwL n=1 Tax=Bartonella TaxID=773 RepID=UPI00235EBB64|nr:MULTISPECIES: VirB2 family type IV secretion system major pilin TrwL [Bartonella]